MEPPRGLSQKIEIEFGRSQVGTISFEILDQTNTLTEIITLNSFAFRNKMMRFWVGYGEIQEPDYLLIGTYRNRELKANNSLRPPLRRLRKGRATMRPQTSCSRRRTSARSSRTHRSWQTDRSTRAPVTTASSVCMPARPGS